MSDYTAELIAVIGDKSSTRTSVASAYARALALAYGANWPVVNRAIVKRWSDNGLVFIKREAWKMRIQL